MDIVLKDERLGKRWLILVRSQMKSSSPLAAGVGALPSTARPLAATQAAWRFYNNERVTLAELVVPLRDYARARTAESNSPFVLVALDWSKLSFPGHEFRADLAELSNVADVGYEITTALAISPDDGAPLAPVELHLKTKDGLLGTRDGARPAAHLDQVGPTLAAAADWNLGKPIVHVIDQEADSIGHWRTWSAAGHHLLIRGGDRVARWEDRALKLTQIRQELERRGAIRDAGAAKYHGRAARLRVAETTVVLDRPARTLVDG